MAYQIETPPIEVEFLESWFNPYFFHLIQDRSPYIVKWGGGGSGKSYDTAKQLIYQCLTLPYFRCIHSRKVFANINDSTYALLRDIIINNDLEPLFKFNKSEKDIICINGNSFLAFGMDSPEKVKSIADPTHVWLEEATEYTLEDFNQLDTRLRTDRAEYTQVILTLNPVAKSNWVYKEFFEKTVPGATLIHSTYRNNPFIDHLKYETKLKRASIGDPNFYNIYSLGLWGVMDINKLFLRSFRPDMVSEKAQFNPELDIYLSWDFNAAASTCLIFQYSEEGPGFIHLIEEVHRAGWDLYDICRHIKKKYPNSFYWVTGDASGGNRSAFTKGNKPAFQILKEELNIAWNQLKKPKANPAIESSRILSNAVLKFEPEFYVTPQAKETIADCEQVTTDIHSFQKKNPERTHCLDALRYFINTFCRRRIKEYNLEYLTEKGLLDATEAELQEYSDGVSEY